MTGAPGIATIGRDTMRALLAQPGRLTADFVAGVRRVGPVTLFVITAVLFAAVRFGASFAEPVELSTPAMAPEWRDKLDALPISGETKANIVTLYENRREIARTTGWESAAVMVCLVPVFALLMQVAYSSSRKPYGQHLAFSLDYFAAVLFAETLATAVNPMGSAIVSVVAGLAVLVWVSWYTVRAMQSCYDGTVGETVFKASMVGFGYLVVYTAMMTGAAAATLYLAERTQ